MTSKSKKPVGHRKISPNRGNMDRRSTWNANAASEVLENMGSVELATKLRSTFRFLQQEDLYRCGAFPMRSAASWEVIEEVDKRRKEGDEVFDANLLAKLRDCQITDELHRRYEDYCNGSSRFTTTPPISQNYPQRLAVYGRQFPELRGSGDRNLPSTYMSLIPRPRETAHPPFSPFLKITEGHGRDACFERPEALAVFRLYTAFYQHAERWGQQDLPEYVWAKVYPAQKNPDNPRGINLAQAENEIFEACMDLSWTEIAQTHQGMKSNTDFLGLPGYASERGLRRAAVHKVLSLITNQENRDTNTPWRRVVFPKPTRKFHYVNFHSWTLSRSETHKDISRHVQNEPFPWVYWHNEWLQKARYLSAWSRQSYNKRYWNDFQRIALPVNFRGPYSFENKCVYHGYWLQVGQSLVALQANLERMAVIRPRWLIQRVVEDIKRGEQNEAIDEGVIPRPDIDLMTDSPNTYRLIDEVDMAWLEFLCQPLTTKPLAGGSPEDTLTIIIDHRLQNLVNDPVHNPFWLTDYMPDHPRPTFRSREMPLEQLLPMINSGGCDIRKKIWKEGTEVKAVTEYHLAAKQEPAGVPVANSLYQFSLKEAKLHCKKLAEMGRVAYKCPQDPKNSPETRWSGKGMLYHYPDVNFQSIGGSIAPVPPGISSGTKDTLEMNASASGTPVTYPERRIRWRYENVSEFELANDLLKEWYTNEMIKHKSAHPDAYRCNKAAWEDGFLPESVWRQGPRFHERSLEYMRQSPAWEDVLDSETIPEEDIGLPFKTHNFIRNLAYRMGLTIRHYQILQSRTSQPSALTRSHLDTALDEWKSYVETARDWEERGENHIANLPFKLSKPNCVIAQTNCESQNKDSEDMTMVYREIREGIIDDLVQNRVMLFPSRKALFVDRKKFMAEFYERANIWSWASEPIRQRQAAYKRKQYFDMKRWPLNRQVKSETKTSIATRADENPNIQSTRSFYKYSLRVGPQPMIPAQSDTISRMISLLGDPDKQNIAQQLTQHLSKEIVKIVKTTNAGSAPGWEIRVIPPGTKIMTSNKTISKPGFTTTSAAAHLKPILRPKTKFIPGPAVFPMGDTILAQVQMSQHLERILDPEPQNTASTIWGFFSDWLTPPPERITLLPDIDLSRAPSTSRLGLKRKVNTAFLNFNGRSPKRQSIYTQHKSSRGRSDRRSPFDSDESSSDSDRTDGGGTVGLMTEFDDILPAGRDHSAVQRSKLSQKKDGTYKIKVQTDLEDVMKIDIASQQHADNSGLMGMQPFMNIDDNTLLNLPSSWSQFQ